MSKKLISLIYITCMLSSTMLAVHELRTPLSLLSRLNNINGSFHYPIKYIDEEKTNVDLWGGAYYRQACHGFCPKVCDSCCNSCSQNCVRFACDSVCNSCNSGVSHCSTGCCDNNSICKVNTNYIGCFDCDGKKVSLAKLFFGKETFHGVDAFNPDSIAQDSVLRTVPLTPVIDYSEKGIVLGIHFEHKVRCKNWRVGFNASLPIKKIEVEADLTCDTCCTLVEERTEDPLNLAERAFLKLEYLPDTDIQTVDVTSVGETYAYRMDLLNDLGLLEFPGGGSITVAGVDLGEKDEFLNPGVKIFPAVAYRPKDDDIKAQLVTLDIFDAADVPTSFEEPRSLAFGNPSDDDNDPGVIEPLVLPADGTIPLNPPASGSLDEKRSRYYRYVDQSTPYIISEADQETIFVVPSYARTNGNNNTMYSAGGMTIKNLVEQRIRELDQDSCCSKRGPELLFSDFGVCLRDSECITGLGDLDTSIFVAYDFTERSFAEVVVGMRFPTGKKSKCPGSIYYVPTGNNGHFEAKIGVDGGWKSKRWFGIHAEAYYAHVLEAEEKRAAQFKGATIRGIGSCVNAKVKWGYFVGHLDMTVFHPENQNMGFTLGYEIYYKRHDKVRFCNTCFGDRAEDFYAEIVQLDSSLLEVDTNILAHKLRGQVYHRWNYFELYAGASRVLGGWNSMKESEVHIGFGINF